MRNTAPEALAQRPPEIAAKPTIPVACGVLVNERGEVLIAQRPAGKIAAGLWEFPGGKIEAGESARQALERELREELGIALRQAWPLIRFRHEYRDRIVILDTWRVDGYESEPHPHEGQRFAWRAPGDLGDLACLPTVAPILRAMRAPPHYVFTPPQAPERFIRAGLERLPAGSLLRLRLPALDDAAYAQLAARIAPQARALGLKLMLDRDPALVAALGAAGWHASGRALRALRDRPLPREFGFAASVHDAEEIERAAALGADALVLGPVQATASHPQSAGLGWARFQALRGLAPQTVYAIGGLGPERLAEARQHGAQGVAGISAYWRC
ncbi:MAG: Nudix family hydrolase [Nevskia sp.]|nr:Nudix family hydrolase [Nevskia sp.]